jgi:hypothetical protein
MKINFIFKYFFFVENLKIGLSIFDDIVKNQNKKKEGQSTQLEFEMRLCDLTFSFFQYRKTPTFNYGGGLIFKFK